MSHHPMMVFYGSPAHAHGPAIDTLDREGVEPVAEVFVVFRGWRVRYNDDLGPVLAPLLRQNVDGDWLPKEGAVGLVEARCHCVERGGVPLNPNRHECGFYGYKTFSRCANTLNYANNWVIGMCMIFRRVEVAERGLRGSKAIPLALLDDQPHAGDLENLWREVPLPALPLTELLAYGREFGFMHDQIPTTPQEA